ncbi:hypothetical protein CEE45_12270 [Candidatus Heimdallarchaeota archaeon B3_Heim]|nr:MAG: hypothetical protein CEE45_12270 [Candidatus Heimdallarchaeota archaeon B3_Heim]
MKYKIVLIFLGIIICTSIIAINMGESSQGSVTIINSPKAVVKVLVVDWLEDPWIDKFREDLDPITPGVQNPLYIHPVNDSIETTFWNTINGEVNIEINRIPPTNSLLQWTDSHFINELETYQPDVIVLANHNFDLWDRFGLNQNERLALYDYLEEGHGLILLGGSVFDMRYKTSSSSEGTFIGSYGHIDRLHLTENPDPIQLRNNYRSSLASMVGLGLMTLYEEAREIIGDVLDSNPNTKDYAPIVWSLPLCPIGVPFNGSFVAEELNDPILSGLGEDFTIDLTHPLKDPSLGKYNTTTVGWQLQYPFYMASTAINATKPYVNQLKNYFREGVRNFINHLKSSDPVGIIPGTATFDITAKTMDEIAENITNSLSELLASMYQSRLNTPTELEIPIHFTIGDYTVDHTLIIPLPVELQALLKPAVISAVSTDKLAAILRYEIGNHRAVTFTFDPTLGESTSQILVKNAISWSAGILAQSPTITIGNLNMSSTLVSTARTHIVQDASLTHTINKLHQPGVEETYQWQFNASQNSIIIYWRDGVGSVTVSKDGQSAETQTYQDGTHYAVVANISEAGLWTVAVTTTQNGLLNPIAIELYQEELEPTSTTTSTDTSTETTTETTTTSGETITSEPTIGMRSVNTLGTLVIMALAFTRKQRKKR